MSQVPVAGERSERWMKHYRTEIATSTRITGGLSGTSGVELIHVSGVCGRRKIEKMDEALQDRNRRQHQNHRRIGLEEWV
jgi:hypothetical protein